MHAKHYSAYVHTHNYTPLVLPVSLKASIRAVPCTPTHFILIRRDIQSRAISLWVQCPFIRKHYLLFTSEWLATHHIWNLLHMTLCVNSSITSLLFPHVRASAQEWANLVCYLDLAVSRRFSPMSLFTQDSAVCVNNRILKQELEASTKADSSLCSSWLFLLMFLPWRSVHPLSANQWEKTTFGFGLPAKTFQWCKSNWFCNCSLKSSLHDCNLLIIHELPMFTTFTPRELPVALPSKMI